MVNLDSDEISPENGDDCKMPFVVDTYFHQYYFRDKRDAHNIYVLGGNFVHKINFKNKTWETLGKGSDELSTS